jgi:hypothetical protein
MNVHGGHPAGGGNCAADVGGLGTLSRGYPWCGDSCSDRTLSSTSSK